MSGSGSVSVVASVVFVCVCVFVAVVVVVVVVVAAGKGGESNVVVVDTTRTWSSPLAGGCPVAATVISAFGVTVRVEGPGTDGVGAGGRVVTADVVTEGVAAGTDRVSLTSPPGFISKATGAL